MKTGNKSGENCLHFFMTSLSTSSDTIGICNWIFWSRRKAVHSRTHLLFALTRSKCKLFQELRTGLSPVCSDYEKSFCYIRGVTTLFMSLCWETVFFFNSQLWIHCRGWSKNCIVSQFKAVSFRCLNNVITFSFFEASPKCSAWKTVRSQHMDFF